MTFSRHYLAQRATLDAVDLAEVQGCRRAHNQLGFAYQVGFVRVAPRIVRIYTLRGFESPRLDHRALGQDWTVLRGVRERPDHRVCRTQASGRPWAEESLLPSDPRARPRLQDRVHPRLPEPAGASHADPTRAPQGRTATRPRPVRPLRPTGPTGSARLRTPNRRGELPASRPRSYHLSADSGDRSCFERGGLGCGRSQLRVTAPYQPDRVGQRPPLRRVPAQPQSRAKRAGSEAVGRAGRTSRASAVV